MANGTVHRFPKRNEDNSIEVGRFVKDTDGTLKKVSQLIFTADSPTLPGSFTEEINNLIVTGEIEMEGPAGPAGADGAAGAQGPAGADGAQGPGGINIVDISDQLEAAKYTYDFVDKDGVAVTCGDIYRVFFNGLNVTRDVDIAEDGLSFTFIDDYEDDVFGHEHAGLIIDFIEE